MDWCSFGLWWLRMGYCTVPEGSCRTTEQISVISSFAEIQVFTILPPHPPLHFLSDSIWNFICAENFPGNPSHPTHRRQSLAATWGYRGFWRCRMVPRWPRNAPSRSRCVTGMAAPYRAAWRVRDGSNFGCRGRRRVVGCVDRVTQEFIFPATVGRSGMRCPQILWISLCKLAELLRYVLVGKEIVPVGDIFEHVQNSAIMDLLLPHEIDFYLSPFSVCINCTIPSTIRMSLGESFSNLSRNGASSAYSFPNTTTLACTGGV